MIKSNVNKCLYKTIKLNDPVKPDSKKLEDFIELINKNGWYTNFGPLHNEFKMRLEEWLETSNLLLVNNGTSALQVAAAALNSNNILTTPFSFVATSCAFDFMGKRLSFSDIERDTFNLCAKNASNAISNFPEIDTIVATHVYGNPCNVDEIKKISNKNRNLKVIYDAAHAIGITKSGESILNFGDASTLSFHATKVFHTIEGGAVRFKDPDKYELAKEIINFGIGKSGYIGATGTNAKFSEMQAAVGLVLLDDFDSIMAHRSSLFELYRATLDGYVELPVWNSEANYNGSYMPIRLPSENVVDMMIERLKVVNIESRKYFNIALDQVYKHDTPINDVINAHTISNTVLCLPLHFYMTFDDVERVCDTVKSVLDDL